MIAMKYDYPLSDEDGIYRLSEAELVSLLDRAYDNGFNAAKSIYDPAATKTYASIYENESEWR